ncbi:hypothetical protein ACHHV8_13920 [Paenibacillus sp. TAB 01]|uniref:hypothetical protein n=1 Tax=Paenibacillus sp. TAB 01 TaxID=3368988 RepID=UPI0037526E4D
MTGLLSMTICALTRLNMLMLTGPPDAVPPLLLPDVPSLELQPAVMAASSAALTTAPVAR